MLNISKPLSASQAQTYHAKEFTAADQNYWKQGDTIQGEWHGRLAENFSLSGAVGAEEFARLSEGQHPQTGKQLVSHRVVHEYRNAQGEMVSPAEHRAGGQSNQQAVHTPAQPSRGIARVVHVELLVWSACSAVRSATL